MCHTGSGAQRHKHNRPGRQGLRGGEFPRHNFTAAPGESLVFMVLTGPRAAVLPVDGHGQLGQWLLWNAAGPPKHEQNPPSLRTSVLTPDLPDSTCLGEASSTRPAGWSTAQAQNGIACQGQATNQGQCWAPSLTLTTIKDFEEPRLQVCKTLGGRDAGPPSPWSSDGGGVCPPTQAALGRFAGEIFYTPTHCCSCGHSTLTVPSTSQVCLPSHHCQCLI